MTTHLLYLESTQTLCGATDGDRSTAIDDVDCLKCWEQARKKWIV